MKKIKLILPVTFILALFFIFTPSKAEEDFRVIYITECIDLNAESPGSGGISGYSNNCWQGNGSCIDNSCPEGLYENRW